MTPELRIQVAHRGAVSDELVGYAEQKVRRTAGTAPRPVLFGRIALGLHENPSVARPASAKAMLDVSGRHIRGQVAATTLREAIDLLDERLRRNLQRLAEETEGRHRETGVSDPGEWRHGSQPSDRPSYFPRPAEEREIVRRKTYESGPVAPKEAAIDLELLDHDFHLFENSDTGQDCVVFRKLDGSLGLLEEAPTETVEQARERLELETAPLAFFRDAESGRGNVLYRRYDGHYGLITPAAPVG
jgi:ribosome-associated translation inhibitor RaiA